MSLADDVRSGRVTRRQFLKGAAVAGGAVVVAGNPLLAACGGNTPTTSASSASPTVKTGGMLTVGIDGGSSKDTLLPLVNVTDADICRANQLYDTLFIFDPSYKRQYALAEEAEPSEGARVWTIRIRDGVQFHDGKSLTADDIAYTFKAVTDPKNPGDAASRLAALDRNNIEVLDPLTVRLHFKSAYSALPEALAERGTGAVRIIPVGFDVANPVGTGPFKYKSFTPGASSVFDRHPNYWREGQPYIDSLTVTDFTDDAARVNALLSGQADAVTVVPSSQVQVITANPKLRVIESKTGSWNPITMRVDTAPFDDARVRQAFRLLTDREQLVKQVLANHGSVANDLFALYDLDYNHDIPQRPFDLDQAKSLLKQAGQQDLSVEFITSPVVPGLVEAAQVFVQQATAAGVKVKLINTDPSTFFDRHFLKAALSQSYWATRGYLLQAADSMLPDAPYNETHWDNPEWLDLVTQALATEDDQKRKQLIGDAQQIEWDKGGYINWGWFNIFDATTERVNGLVPDASGFSLTSYTFSQAWLSS